MGRRKKESSAHPESATPEIDETRDPQVNAPVDDVEEIDAPAPDWGDPPVAAAKPEVEPEAEPVAAPEPTEVPANAIASREYPDRIVYVTRDGRKHVIRK